MDVLKVTEDGDAQKVMMAYSREKGIWLIGEWNGWNKVIDVLKVTEDGDAQKVMMAYARDRPAYLYRFSRDIPILALNHDFPISCGGVPILEDAGIFSARRFRLGLFSPVIPNPPRILHLPPIKALRCRYK